MFMVWQMRKKLVKKETVIPDPDYRIPVVLLGASYKSFYTLFGWLLPVVLYRIATLATIFVFVVSCY